jgi:DegV family protein with EDD domain
MGQRTVVITDSLACLPPEIAGRYNIRIVPLSFIIKGRVYRDWVDISPSEAYQLFLENPDTFQSSAPSPMDFINVFREAGRDAGSIFCVTVSDKLSMTYQAALLAKEQVKMELPQISLEVFNSRTATATEGFIALAVARAAADGKDFAGVREAAQEVSLKVNLVAVLDTIRHVYRSGRIPKVASQVGSVLHVKPMLGITPDSEGTVRFFGIIRSRQSGIERMLKIMKDQVGDNPVHVAVMHAYVQEEANKLKETVTNSFNCAEAWLSDFSPLMGYAIGTGALGLAFYGES